MAVFKVGDRVRIRWSIGWPELAGQAGTIVGHDPHWNGHAECEWDVFVDSWGSNRAPMPSARGRTYFCPRSDQLEPIIPGDALVAGEDEVIREQLTRFAELARERVS